MREKSEMKLLFKKIKTVWIEKSMVKVVGMHKMKLLKFTSSKRNENRSSSSSSYSSSSNSSSSTTSKIAESTAISPSDLMETSHVFQDFVVEAMKDRPSGVSHRKSLRRSKLVVLNVNSFEDCESCVVLSLSLQRADNT